MQLSLDDGRVVKVEKEGQDQVVRVQQEVGGWIWQYEDESDRVKWNFMKLPGDPPSG